MFLHTRGLAKSANGLKEDFFSIELWSKWAAVHLRQMICRFQWQWEERGRAHACDSSDTEIMTAHSRWRRRQGEGNGKMRTNRYLGHQQTTDLMVKEQYQVANFCFWNGLSEPLLTFYFYQAPATTTKHGGPMGRYEPSSTIFCRAHWINSRLFVARSWNGWNCPFLMSYMSYLIEWREQA